MSCVCTNVHKEIERGMSINFNIEIENCNIHYVYVYKEIERGISINFNIEIEN